MTDLISSLADSIVALINAKPQSPTKAEVEAVVREHVEQSVMRIKADADILWSHTHIPPPGRVVWSAPCDFTDWTPDPTAGCSFEHTTSDGAVIVAPTEESLMDAVMSHLRSRETERWSQLSPAERATRPCPGYASEEHYWEVDPWSTRDVGAHEIARLCCCGATKP